MQLTRTVNEYGQVKLVFEFDQKEARGTVVIEEGGYGLWVTMPEVGDQPLFLIDLFPPTCPGHDHGRPQLVVHSPVEEDPVGRLIFEAEQTRWDPEEETP